MLQTADWWYDRFRLKHLKLIASPGLDPEVHVFILRCLNEKTWTAGSSPAEGIAGTIPVGRIVL
jgi:hypothetical protein